VPDDGLDVDVAALANTLANGPTKAFGRMKRLLRQSGTHELRDHLAEELETFIDSARTSDFAEAIEARLGKRAPRFVGS
jgi:2-(1,2-epoxy-1,2-dihydrophenyl)acetyl-CoA isomerase